MVVWRVSDKDIIHLEMSRQLKSQHSWSAALALSFDNISDPPHESSPVKSTFTINDHMFSISEEKGLVPIIIWIGFIMFRNVKSSVNSKCNISQMFDEARHDRKLSTLWNKYCSISLIWSISTCKHTFKHKRIGNLLLCSWRSTKSDSFNVKNTSSCYSTSTNKGYDTFKHFYIQ